MLFHGGVRFVLWIGERLVLGLLREGSIVLLEAARRDERWEIDFFADGHVEVVVFTVAPTIEGDEALGRLFE